MAKEIEASVNVNDLKKIAEYMFNPLLDSFEEEDMELAIDKEVYLPEMTANIAPYYMEMLLTYTEDVPKFVVESLSVQHVLDWMRMNQKDKYRWFKCGGEEEKERIKWLKWNIEGFKLFILDAKE